MLCQEVEEPRSCQAGANRIHVWKALSTFNGMTSASFTSGTQATSAQICLTSKMYVKAVSEGKEQTSTVYGPQVGSEK